MEKIISYVRAKTKKCLANLDDYQNDFHECEFSTFLLSIAEKHYKNEKMLEVFKDINHISISCVSKEELVDYLETTKKGFVKARLQKNPVYFSTNPMSNLIQLWDFEICGEMIKEIDILLTKC